MTKQILVVLFAVLVLATTIGAMPTISRPIMASRSADVEIDTDTALDKILSGKLKARKEARLVRKLLDLGDNESQRQRRDTSAQAAAEKLKLIKTSIEQTKTAITDLYHRAEETFDLFCAMKKDDHVPTDDPELATCELWAKFLLKMHTDFNIPDHEKIEIHSSHTPEQHIENVFGKSLVISSKFRYVLANVTTMESDQVCGAITGRSTCTPKCSTKDPADPGHAKEPYKLWCKLNDVRIRINMFEKAVTETMSSLNIQTSQIDTVITLTSSSNLKEGTRISYNFASLWQMKEHMKMIKEIVGLLSNYIV